MEFLAQGRHLIDDPLNLFFHIMAKIAAVVGSKGIRFSRFRKSVNLERAQLFQEAFYAVVNLRRRLLWSPQPNRGKIAKHSF